MHCWMELLACLVQWPAWSTAARTPLEHCSKKTCRALRQGALAGPKEALQSSKSQTDTAHVRKSRSLRARLVPQTPAQP